MTNCLSEAPREASEMFVDRVTIFVSGGHGGRGMCSFRREKYVPLGGPDGGDGGHGGSVIIRALAGADSLAGITYQKHWRAVNGQPGGSANCTGRSADDLVIEVPPGTIVRDRDRGHVLKDLVQAGDQVTVAHGGKGGRGNKAFATSTNQAPREFEPGEKGEERWLTLELKVIADVGLIGLPNAGKSTLLSRLSRATPEIADYPFTTKYPNLGMVDISGDHAFVLADLPGLIEGRTRASASGMSFSAMSSGRGSWCIWSSRSRRMVPIRFRTTATFAANWNSTIPSWRKSPSSWW